MDPTETLRELLSTLIELEGNPTDMDARDYAVELCQVLGDWLTKGGLPPVMDGIEWGGKGED